MIYIMLVFRRLVFGLGLLAGLNAAAQERIIKVGEKAPEIVLSSLAGDAITLSSQKGKVVLVDFWASWCAPCMEEQPELKKLYNQFNKSRNAEKKFEIYGVSLDSKKPAWQAAVKKYNIKWIQVSDLKFWTSPVAKTYEIDALPFNVLLDKEGTIVGINLHGKELEDAVAAELAE
ncbi:TlpA family protein disulfide reductase [Dyadobacter sp. CY107]|uniref:TlpA family protein disulfide reductase n=1 Tax=Dyadobacter fanqingshengii TaxID=2906443 RepID=UPI001F2F3CB2|nr:TlpA disulfide reductase family protein [Dyadobacter fanqingshengii]MCF2501838.1 TlpA family protein disulfide reductase [Dyadobacter fanqingshengii]